jgi:hypothetical protein
MCQSYSGALRETYNIYFGNSTLFPTIRAAPANYPPSEVWMLDEGRGDVMIDDVRDLFVEFMISDSAVRPCALMSLRILIFYAIDRARWQTAILSSLISQRCGPVKQSQSCCLLTPNRMASSMNDVLHSRDCTE